MGIGQLLLCLIVNHSKVYTDVLIDCTKEVLSLPLEIQYFSFKCYLFQFIYQISSIALRP
jgi:hypothetical protein